MPKYRVWMIVTATTSVVIEADSEEKAMEIAGDEYGDTAVDICHQCSREVSEPTITRAIEAVEID